MLIYNDDFKPILLEDSEAPIGTELVWTLDLNIKDFIFTPISFLQDHNERGVGFKIGGQYIELPESWYVLIIDPTSGELDLIQIAEIKGRIFDVYIYSHETSALPRTQKMVTFNSRVYKKFCFPILEKNVMIVHPIDDKVGIVVSPHNSWKIIRDMNVMDLIE